MMLVAGDGDGRVEGFFGGDGGAAMRVRARSWNMLGFFLSRGW